MTEEGDRERLRLTFDTAAERYKRIRPRYLPEVLLAYSAISPSSPPRSQVCWNASRP